MSTQDLFLKCCRRGEESLGIHLRRYPKVGVGDDHKPVEKRVLGVAHRACCVTFSIIPDAETSGRTDTERGARTCAHTTATSRKKVGDAPDVLLKDSFVVDFHSTMGHSKASCCRDGSSASFSHCGSSQLLQNISM